MVELGIVLFFYRPPPCTLRTSRTLPLRQNGAWICHNLVSGNAAHTSPEASVTLYLGVQNKARYGRESPGGGEREHFPSTL